MYRVRHILLSDEKRAWDLHKIITARPARAVSEFIAQAKASSLEKVSAAKGGMMPPFLEGELDDAFEMATAGLKPGQISTPVTSKMGNHIIMLDSVTSATYNDEVAERCARILERRKLEELFKTWKKKHNVEVKDETLRPYLDL